MQCLFEKTKVYLVHNYKKAYKECYTTIHKKAVGNVIRWLSHDKNFMAPQIILTCRMPSDTPNSITGHVDLLLSGEMSMHEI